MTGLLLRRLADVLPTLFAVATLIFLLLHLVPGDPAELMLGDGARAGDLAELRSRLGLDQPIGRQYGRYLAGLVVGDLGTSLHFKRPVAALLGERLPATLALASVAMSIALLIALPLGAASALARGGWLDRLAHAFSLVAVSVPTFWLGPVLILLFAIRLDLVPVSGRAGLSSLVLPALTLGLAQAGFLTRLVRSAVATELERPYVQTAYAKGLGPFRVVSRHALRNALIPVVTVVALQLGSLLTGSIITETVFAWPGVGRLLVQAIHLRDYPLVQGTILFIATIYLAMNFAADLLYGIFDPRVRAR